MKHADVPQELIDKYKNILPDELIWLWENMGFGIYENGYLQLVNPEEWDFVFEYIDKLYDPTIVWGMTAMGDLLFWEEDKPKNVNRVFLINNNKGTSEVITQITGFLNIFIGSDFFITSKDYFNDKPYLEMKDKLPKLEYGQCYGYVPALALGGSRSNKNLQVVNAKAYIHIIGQAVGKIYDLS
nr:GAD-like domain-containing protein [Capnocytophaga canimorsus]